ncbi:MAG TPA: ABC transporter permease [Tepidisphaeraceae bacterium]|nr:ABC transporter permease [Tepidisphaeraceae bacterium]
MRSVLTCLGIIIGVSAVIAMMEVGQGSSSLVRETIARLGADNILIYPGTAQNGGVSQGAGTTVSLRPDDCDAIERECTAVRAAAPLLRARIQLVYGAKNWQPSNMNGTTPAYLDIHNWPIAEGDMFTDADVRNRSKVCVVGQTLVRELFDGRNPVGEELRLNSVAFRVVGVLATKGANMFGGDQDDVLLAPWTTIKYHVYGSSSSASGSTASSAAASTVNNLDTPYPSTSEQLYPALDATQQADYPQQTRFASIDQILVAADGSNRVPLAMRQITQVLRDRHHLGPGQADDFNVRDLTEFTNAMKTMTSTMSTLLLCVAIISLIVGGVGIMNIMLVSVTERTREIGLRMAVGARARDILSQFLIEAVVLCLLGGMVGIVLGRGTSVLVRVFLNWATEVSVLAIVIAVAVSATVGVVFGFYPAYKASNLDPIEALRYE